MRMILNCPEQAIILKIALHHGPRRRNEEWVLGMSMRLKEQHSV